MEKLKQRYLLKGKEFELKEKGGRSRNKRIFRIYRNNCAV